MNYTEFVNAMLREVRRQSETEVKMELYTATKNNGTRRTGILFRQREINLAPTIYLEEFYEEYLHGKLVEELAESVWKVYEEIRIQKSYSCRKLFDYEAIKDKIVYKVIRKDTNQDMLAQVPYEPYLDLAVVYYIRLVDTQFGAAAIQIRNEHLRYWGVSKEEIRETARKNTPQLLPVTVQQIVPFMYMASNKEGNFGAAVMWYPCVWKAIRKLLGENFYILPSSVHEVILIPESFDMEPERMAEIVKEINQVGVEPEDVLSDTVYYYNSEEIEIAVK